MKTLITNAREASRGIYLTLISVIESLVLGYLFSSIDYTKLMLDNIDYIYLFQAIAIFQVGILIWHEYAIGTVFYSWICNWTDSVIPFLYGFNQFMLISFFKNNQLTCWFIALAFFVIISIFSYANQGIKSRRYREHNIVLTIVPKFHISTLIILVGSLTYFIILALVSSKYNLNNTLLFLLVLLSNLMLLLFAIYTGIVQKYIFLKATSSVSNDQ